MTSFLKAAGSNPASWSNSKLGVCIHTGTIPHALLAELPALCSVPDAAASCCAEPSLRFTPGGAPLAFRTKTPPDGTHRCKAAQPIELFAVLWV